MLHPKRTRRPAAAAAEFAVLLPFLALTFLAALDFGRVFYATQILEACAQAGARYAGGSAEPSGSPSPTDAVTAACAAGTSLDPPLAAQNVTVTVDATGGTATVVVAYDFSLLTPILAPAAQVHLTRTVVAPLAPTPGN